MNSQIKFIKEYSDTEEKIISDEFNRVKSMFTNMNFYFVKFVVLLVNNTKIVYFAKFYLFICNNCTK